MLGRLYPLMRLPAIASLLLGLGSCAHGAVPEAQETAQPPSPAALAAPAQAPAETEAVEEAHTAPPDVAPPEPVVSTEAVAPDRVEIRGGQSRGKRVPRFTLDRTEVTVDAYARCVAAQKCDRPSAGPGFNWKVPGRERHPINGVSASMAASYCEWAGARLPSEREWAWAARGREDNRLFPWGRDPPTCALAVMMEDGSGCGLGHTADVGSRPGGSSRDGVQDLAGNVAEWVENSASGPSEVWAVVVGGGFADAAGSLGVHHRQGRLPPSLTVSTSIGFRCAANRAK